MHRPHRPLPPEVIAALQKGDAGEAARLLREHEPITQGEAEEALTDYQENNPPIRPRGAAVITQSLRNGLIWVLFIFVMIVVYLLIAG